MVSCFPKLILSKASSVTNTERTGLDCSTERLALCCTHSKSLSGPAVSIYKTWFVVFYLNTMESWNFNKTLNTLEKKKNSAKLSRRPFQTSQRLPDYVRIHYFKHKFNSHRGHERWFCIQINTDFINNYTHHGLCFSLRVYVLKLLLLRFLGLRS